MTSKRERLFKLCTPIDENSNKLDMSNDDLVKMSGVMIIAHKRTGRLALNMVNESMNLRDALSAAYVQGMEDAVISTVNKEIPITTESPYEAGV